MNLSASSSSGSFLRVRKRVNSSVDDSYASASFKRPRVSSISGNAAFSRGASVAIGEGVSLVGFISRTSSDISHLISG